MEVFILELNSHYPEVSMVFHVQFSWCPDLYILFEKLTEQIGVWLGLGTLLRFEAPNDLRANIKTK